MRFSEACYGFSQKEQGSNKCCSRLREAQLCYGKGVEEVVDQHRKLVTFEEHAASHCNAQAETIVHSSCL